MKKKKKKIINLKWSTCVLFLSIFIKFGDILLLGSVIIHDKHLN